MKHHRLEDRGVYAPVPGGFAVEEMRFRMGGRPLRSTARADCGPSVFRLLSSRKVGSFVGLMWLRSSADPRINERTAVKPAGRFSRSHG